MTNLIRLLICLLLICPSLAFGQAASSGTAGEITCAADGSSTEVLNANAARYSFSLTNTAGKDIRISFLATGTADLTSSNSFALGPGKSYVDSFPGVYIGRVVCMSTDGTTGTLDVTETTKN